MTAETALVRDVGHLETAGFGARSGAALLDLLVAYGILLISSWIWMFVTNPAVTSHEQAVPRYVTAITVTLVWLYLTGTVAGGGTLGMRVAGLCVRRADNASPPGPARAAARSLVLLIAVWLLSQVHPVLVAVYFLLMLVIPKRRLPHDLVVATVVAHRAPRATTPADPEAAVIRQAPPNLDLAQSRTLLAEIGRAHA